jgi:hypothetical protein
VRTSPVVGLSVGATTLAAVTETRSITAQPVITRAGIPIRDFVGRVGDPVGIVAADGSRYSGAALLADALYELARTASAGRPLPQAAAVAYPAQWRPAEVEALGRALRRIPDWSSGPVLVPDYAAALTALREHPGLPTAGVVAVCDFGGSATTLTLVHVADGCRLVGGSVHLADFSGDLVDRALLTHVLSGAGATPGGAGTLALGALTRLRNGCREAKERLSTQSVATVPGEPAGVRGDIRITRPELDAIIREPMTGVVAALAETLQRNGIALTDLVAVASVGGMAAVPAVTAALSERFRVPVITVPRPALASATGAALHAAAATADVGATVVGPVRSRPEPVQLALAWSHAPEVPDVVPQLSNRRPGRPQPRPQVDFARTPAPSGRERTPWYRTPLAVAAATLAVIAGAGGATVLALRAAPALPAPSVPTTQSPAQPEPVVAAGRTGDEPAPRTVIAVPAPPAIAIPPLVPLPPTAG